ncbi:ATP-binding protein [Serratia rubidaea]|nr:ATP-binding protein [Serratia rubidaea]
MRNVNELLKRLGRMMPEGTKPKFSNAEELMQWHREQEKISAEQVTKENAAARLRNVLGRSGICELHQSCTFDNYKVECEGQANAVSKARAYADDFGTGFTSFIFSGSYGTGKNHMAAAIGNHLLNRGRSVLVVTVPDLMLKIRDSYGDGETSEARLMKDLFDVDLLIIDEVGVQRENRHEFIVLNQIVDRRLAGMKPVGMLTNLNQGELTRVLGERIMDRMKMDGGLWVNFNWGSYRGRVSKLRAV